MVSVMWAQLRGRGSRTVALLLGLVVACTGFTVLTSQTQAATLQVRGTVAVNARSAYNILVRPVGARSAAEVGSGLVQAGFLSGIRGGISLDQWHQIQRVPGVAVAAPVAMIGYVVPKVIVPVRPGVLAAVKASGGRLLLRSTATWTADNGLTVQRAHPGFTYITPNPLKYHNRTAITTETAPGLRPARVCNDNVAALPWTVSSGPALSICLDRSDAIHQVRTGVWLPTDVTFPFPFLVAAIDPVSEARLNGLDRAMTSGSFLTPTAQRTRVTPIGRAQEVPVIVASAPVTAMRVDYQVQVLPEAAAAAVGAGRGADSQLRTPGRTVATGSVDQSQAYRRLIDAMATPSTKGEYYARQLSYLYTVDQARYTGAGTAGPLVVRTVRNHRAVWADPYGGDALGSWIPPTGDDTAFRVMRGYQWPCPCRLTPPAFIKQGVFDAAKLPGYSSLSQVPLGIYTNTVLTGATPADRAKLRGRPLAPSANVANYGQPAPLMLTTLQALPTFTSTTAWSGLPGNPADSRGLHAPVSPTAPISSIRVRVVGATGIDQASRERVRLAAQSITVQTGLAVDITLGSSPTPRTIVLPAGAHGRPPLTLTEDWVKKGVAVAILKAVDKKSLVLFVLVLAVCGLFVANTTTASARSRRSELGVLACLGWTRRALFTMVLGELALLALAAGLVGAILSLAVGAALHLQISAGRALLAVPAALLVAGVAGAVPVWRAARAQPLEAVHPTVARLRSTASPNGVTTLALANVRRVPGRSLLAGLGVAIAVAALTLVAGAAAAFQGSVVGTLLGDAVAVQIRGADYVATAAILALAGAGVANVLFLNIRERGPEIATLRAIGWPERTIDRLLVSEGIIIGATGSTAGALLGGIAITAFIGHLTNPLIWTAAAALLAGAVIATGASLLPVLSLQRLPTALLLTEQ